MKFVQGAPVFAAEVRSEGDYGEAAERAMAAKRADYFAAGGLVHGRPGAVRVSQTPSSAGTWPSRNFGSSAAENCMPV